MQPRLLVYLNRVSMKTRKGREECSAEFAATLATGTLDRLEPDSRQLAALPGPLERSCRIFISDRAMLQAALDSEVLASGALYDGETRRLEWKHSVTLERARVKKEQDKDYQARVRILFLIKLDEEDGWPARDLVGKWLTLGGNGDSGSKG